MKKHSLIFVCIYLILTGVQGQSPRPFYSIQSPNASVFKSGVESPVTLDVGKAGVNIPVYTMEDKDLKLDLSLSYNSNGVKPDVHPGWVGQNWNLSAGMVTRNIRGVPDEAYWREDYVLTIDGDNTGTVVMPVGYFYNYGTLAGSDWNSTSKIAGLAKDGSEPNTFWKEAEPDEFVFNCGGYSGKFYLTQNGYVQVQGHPDLKVDVDIVYNIPFGFDPQVPLNPNNPNSFTSVQNYGIFYRYSRSRIARIMGFRITTPDGVTYEYGMYGKDYDESDTFDEVEFTADIFDQYYFSEIFTTWYLKKITSPVTGATINMFYGRGYPIMQAGRSFSFYQMGGSAKGFMGWLFGGVSAYTEEAKEEYNGRFIRPTYLKYIETSDSRMDFVSSPSTELKYNYVPIVMDILDRSRYYDRDYIAPALYSRLMLGNLYYNPNLEPKIIRYSDERFTIIRYDGYIEDLYFDQLKWQKLDYIDLKPKGATGYSRRWTFNYSNSTAERLLLLGMQDSNIPQPYNFSYDNSSSLPGYNSMLIDHWGYFNNRFVQVDIGNSQTLIDYKGLREPVDAYLYSGILNKVTYPTGGYKEFTFEPNKYKAIVSRNSGDGSFYITPLGSEKKGGGLRIKQIRESGGNGLPDMTTLYEYGDGLLNGDVQYYWPGYQGALFNGNVYQSDRFVTESLIPATENTSGGIVSYEKVTERQSGLGRKEYYFTGFNTNPDIQGNSIDPQKSVYSPFGSKSFERGLLKEVRTFDNSSALPLIKEKYLYQPNPGLAANVARAVQSRGLRLFGGDEVNAMEGTSYAHYLYPYQQKSKQTDVLDKSSGTYLTTLEEYTYDNDPQYNDNLLKEVKVTASDGSTVTIVNKHTLDFTTGNLGTAYTESSGLSALLEKHILDREISSYKLIQKSGSTANLVKSATCNTFRRQPNGTPVGYKSYNMELSAPASSFTLAFDQSSYQLDDRFKEVAYYKEYDSYNNPAEITQNTSGNEAYIWGYNGRFVVAAAKNASWREVAYTSFESEEKGNWSYAGTTAPDVTAPTGERVYNLGLAPLILAGLNSGKTYVLTYWVKGSATPTIIAGSEISGRSGALYTYRGWTQFRRTFTGTTSINIDGNMLIDEVRLHPEDAAMETCTYDPLVGITSKTNDQGEITYYEYDSSQRIKTIMDQNGKKIKGYDYHYHKP
ncbi:hypothetical protein [Arcticibacter tournemirensis]